MLNHVRRLKASEVRLRQATQKWTQWEITELTGLLELIKLATPVAVASPVKTNMKGYPELECHLKKHRREDADEDKKYYEEAASLPPPPARPVRRTAMVHDAKEGANVQTRVSCALRCMAYYHDQMAQCTLQAPIQ